MHPLRLQYELLSDQNPLMRPLAGLAEQVREERQPAAADNPLAKLEAEASRQIEAALDGYRDLRDRWYEQVFLAVYGSPLLQALVGLRASDEPPRAPTGRRPGPSRRSWRGGRRSCARGSARAACARPGCARCSTC